MIDRRTLMQVQSENWRNHSAGGEVGSDVMADLGFTRFEEFDDVIIDGARLEHQTDIVPVATETLVPGESQFKGIEPLEMPGRNRGRNNPWNEPPSKAEVRHAWSSMTTDERQEQIARNHRGATVARVALQLHQTS